MRRQLRTSRTADQGFIVSAELALITTILVIGLVVGLVAIRDAMVAELHDIAEALGELDQSFEFQGIQNTDGPSLTEGSNADDRRDRDGGGANGGPFSTNARIGGDDIPIAYLVNDDQEGSALIP